ncbi:hypothetical protein HRG_004509 [Hirsutella rhossiliensis]|uniref:Uncharacterized protein n=1 Tax=Hirsutella rhossiliensis TaxID=111463 RepID=A0A9P8SIN8_9HYPO|nr:uncharacterized protein HRG_04509 [Hirsutella rhossiliensis]KAH0964081.1 hypothetical protein HRG_04509 [Hirsutella rhossiliensis]
MTGAVSTPRYGADDFETASIRSAAPSYVSEAPSYHSAVQYLEAAPPYAPRANTSPESSPPRHQTSTPRPQTIGLPPIPPLNPQSIVTLHNFRIPTWSANNAPAARHYRNVAERRMTDNRYTANDLSKRPSPIEPPLVIRDGSMPPLRPLEDPYLVGEVAARQARRERLARESGDDILIREDRQWDWLLAHMKDSEERQRSGTRPRRDPDAGPRKKLLHRLGGRLLP